MYGVEPSDNPARDLYLAGIASIDAQAAELVRPDNLASRTIQYLAEQSADRGENHHNESGSSGPLFHVTAGDYFNPGINSYTLFGDESLNDFRVKYALLPDLNVYGQHDLYSLNYWPAMELGKQQAGDAQWQQTKWFLTAPIALPATLSAGMWLVTSPLAAGGLAWFDLNMATMDGPYIPGPLGAPGAAVPNRLVTAVDGVVPANLPTGVTYEGPLYRAVPSGGDPLDMSFSINANGRYTEPGRGGLYFSSNARIVEAEFVGNGSSLVGRDLNVFPVSSVDNLLDLTNPVVREQVGVSLSDITRHGGTPAWRYEVTQPLGRLAESQGYSGIIAPSAQADGGVNLILFDPKGVK